jgi:nicotinate-nucleotide adenylyltransferase
MNIGLLGGTFNPVHNAHLRIAEAARLACQLDKVIFIPAADPPHKVLAGDVSFAHRAAMVRLAVAGHPGFEVSLLEGERGGKSYSYDTLKAFLQWHPAPALHFIIGADSFLEIGTWHRYRELFGMCNMIVVERPGCIVADPFAALPDEARCHFVQVNCNIRHESGTVVTFISGVPLDVSSTEIRQKAAAGADITAFVPPDVAAYISQQRIYHQCP